ncbi:MAG: HlyD family efflux transporter periplasmic adaptor subunit [Verrucomicrobiales bacterium]|nr:HlyD family efflux transporter periplasmic adaptor subunit [Verrucomicrobiales bacterium]
MTSPASVPPPAPANPRPNRRRSRRWVPYLLGGALVALLALGFRPQPVPVETTAAKRGTLQATVDEEGRTRIRQRYRVSAPVTGQLRRVPFKAGAEVLAGKTVLAVIDPIPSALLDARSRSLAEARRDSAKANLEKARTALHFATTDLNRSEQLYKERTVSKQELEASQWREAAAAKELAAAESALRQVEAELAEFNPPPAASPNSGTAQEPPNGGRPPVEVFSPVNGKVLRVIEEDARVVTAGTPIVDVGDPADLEIVIEVLSRDGAALKPGAEVLLDQWGSDQPLQARVRLVEPAAFTKVSALGVEEQRVNVIADLVSPPSERPGLGDHYRVEAHIVVWKAENVLKLPAGALFRSGADWSVYRLVNDRATKATVQVGRSSGTETQIAGGLDEGAVVILYPGDRVHDGIRVKPITISP